MRQPIIKRSSVAFTDSASSCAMFASMVLPDAMMTRRVLRKPFFVVTDVTARIGIISAAAPFRRPDSPCPKEDSRQ